MTTATASIPVVALEEYLLTQGSSKAVVLAKAIHLSETSTRKMLKRLEGEGKVVKDGQLFAWVSSSTPKTKAAKAQGGGKRDDVRTRDNLVLSYIQRLASNEGETVSRDELVKRLNEDGHSFSGSFVYLSLYRLHAASEIERVHVGKRAPEWRVAYAS